MEPMYLGNLIITATLALMSGLWYVSLIAWIACAFVYVKVIPQEEQCLRGWLGDDYEDYCRAVRRLIPKKER